MAYKADDITKYVFSGKDKILFDTNIWLFLYGPYPPTDSKVSDYSGAYSRALNSGSTIYLDLLVIAEYVNRYTRIIHGLFTGTVLNTPKEFKQFRKSENFKQVAQQITSDFERIGKTAQRMGVSFPDLPLDDILESQESGECDFNDLVIAEVCRTHKLALVTDDSDFRGLDLNVLTANQKLLA